MSSGRYQSGVVRARPHLFREELGSVTTAISNALLFVHIIMPYPALKEMDSPPQHIQGYIDLQVVGPSQSSTHRLEGPEEALARWNDSFQISFESILRLSLNLSCRYSTIQSNRSSPRNVLLGQEWIAVVSTNVSLRSRRGHKNHLGKWSSPSSYYRSCQPGLGVLVIEKQAHRSSSI